MEGLSDGLVVVSESAPASPPTSNIELFALGTAIVLALIVLALRTHVALMILVTCAGFLLTTLWGATVFSFLSGILPGESLELARTVISLVILIVPALLVGHHFRRTQSHRILQQVVPSIFWAIFVSALSIRFLPAALQDTLTGQSHIVLLSQEFLNVLVLAAIVVAIVEFMSERTQAHGKRYRRSLFRRH